ncbi:MAG: hypothetical protein EPO24_12845 [Bacteroidetes bacterium]|nr:MAG: hypothetical protein EPO24_12845 [Bacteroidota bacterium]
MNIVEQLIKELQLWKPQREGLKALDEIIKSVEVGRGIAKQKTITGIISEPKFSYLFKKPTQKQEELFKVQDELNPGIGTTFPSFTFSIATGGGKTMLMGACIAYLYKTKGYKNFFILSKGDTIYNKHRNDDFRPSSSKYVFKGISDFPSPRIIDGDNYILSGYPDLFSDDLHIYIFNIEKIFNERTDVEFKFHKLNENLGGSFADILREKNDLVMLMDESHNVRAEQSLKAINALKPILGLEFTATPKVNNIIYAYSLREAIIDGYVKRPIVITRRDDDSLIEEQEDIKLMDGLLLHERKKVLLETFCLNNGLPIVKPRVLICAPPSVRGAELKECDRIAEKLQSDEFMKGQYKGKVISIHQGSDDEQIQKLLDLEKPESTIEVVIHVNKLKEGWDVKTIYTIIPLRVSASEIMTQQTLGRGLRLPFGRQLHKDSDLSKEEHTERLELDTLEIISHEKYSAVLAKAQEVLDAVGVRIGSSGEIEQIKIEPDGEEQYKINIPVVSAKVTSNDEISLEKISPTIEEFYDLDQRLIGKDIATEQDREIEYETILEQCKGSLVNFFVRLLCDEYEEFYVGTDKKQLQEFVKSYLDKANVVSGKREEILFKNRRKIVEDIFSQLNQKLQAKSIVLYQTKNEPIVWGTYWRNFPKGYKVKHKDKVIVADVIDNIISGYQKTIFTKNIFDSKEEKFVADILHKDKEVKCWIRPPSGQFKIETKKGSYHPDFVVRTTNDEYFVLEVKMRKEILEAQSNNNHDVVVKTKAAQVWCETIIKATDKKWSYKLIPHDQCVPTKSFRGIISSAVSL